MSDIYVIETNRLKLKSPFVPNDVIIENIRKYLGEAYDDDYFLKKILRARSKFDIVEPI